MPQQTNKNPAYWTIITKKNAQTKTNTPQSTMYLVTLYYNALQNKRLPVIKSKNKTLKTWDKFLIGTKFAAFTWVVHYVGTLTQVPTAKG